MLQVYRDSFETDMKIMNGEKQLKKIDSSIKMIGGSPEKSTEYQHPMSPSSQAQGVNGGLPPPRMKVILEQAHNKIATLKSEGAVWIQHSEKLFDVCRMLATRIAQKLGPPPGTAPKRSSVNNNAGDDEVEEEEGPGGIQPPPTTTTTTTTTKSNKNMDQQKNAVNPATSTNTTSIADAPIGNVSEEVARTKEYLHRYLKGPKPPLSSKLLSRPPYRYLHDLIMALQQETGFAQTLFTEEETHSAKSTPRNVKISFLQKVVAYSSLLIQRRVDIFSDPEQIVAGLECGKTNRMLQCVVEAISIVFKESSSNQAQAQQIFNETATKALRGDKPTPITFQDDNNNNGNEMSSTSGGSNDSRNMSSSSSSSSSSMNSSSSSNRTNKNTNSGNSGSSGNKSLENNSNIPSRLSANDIEGLELVLRLLRSKYLSDVARLESKRDRASLFSCGSAAAKLARVLRLEARKCLDESMKNDSNSSTNNNDDDDASGTGEITSTTTKSNNHGDKMADMARQLESHASIVEPQVPSAPSNRSPEHMRQVRESVNRKGRR